MRLTLEALGHTLTLAIERDTELGPDHPRGDVFATTERAEVLDFDRTPIGFAHDPARLLEARVPDAQ